MIKSANNTKCELKYLKKIKSIKMKKSRSYKTK